MAERLPAWSGFHQVTANPKIDTVEQLVTQFRAEGCDSMVAIGGGSLWMQPRRRQQGLPGQADLWPS